MGPRGAATAPTTDTPTEPVTTAVVAVAVGEGLSRLLRSVGVHEVVAGGQSMNPSTAQILEAVERAPSEVGDRAPEQQEHRRRSREQVDELTEREVDVVPTHSVVEALAALVVYDPDAPLDVNVGGDGRRGERACAPARSRRPCATASPSAVRSRRVTGSRSRATGSASRRRLGSRGGDRAGRPAGRRRQRARHGARSVPTRARPTPARAARAPRPGAPARRGRGARGRPAALPVSSSASSSRGGGAARASRSASSPRTASPSCGPSVTQSLAGSSRWGSTTVLDLLEHYPRRYHDRTAHRGHREPRGRRRGDRLRRGQEGVGAVGRDSGGRSSRSRCSTAPRTSG